VLESNPHSNKNLGVNGTILNTVANPGGALASPLPFSQSVQPVSEPAH